MSDRFEKWKSDVDQTLETIDKKEKLGLLLRLMNFFPPLRRKVRKIQFNRQMAAHEEKILGFAAKYRDPEAVAILKYTLELYEKRWFYQGPLTQALHCKSCGILYDPFRGWTGDKIHCTKCGQVSAFIYKSKRHLGIIKRNKAALKTSSESLRKYGWGCDPSYVALKKGKPGGW